MMSCTIIGTIGLVCFLVDDGKHRHAKTLDSGKAPKNNSDTKHIAELYFIFYKVDVS